MIAQQDSRQGALRWRAVLSIVAIFGWLIFMVIWLFFLTSGMGEAQNIAVFLISLLILIAVLALTWVTWALRFPAIYPASPAYGQYHHRPRWRSVLGGIAGIIWLTFLVIWLFFYANQFSFYQNLGAILASLLIVGGVTWAIGQLGRA